MIIVFVGNFNVSYTSETHHANTLEDLGHKVIRLQEGKATGNEILAEAEKSDLLVWVHTHGWQTLGMSPAVIFMRLRDMNIPTVTYHLDLWFGINRQNDLENDSFYKTIGHFFTVDKKMADWFNKNTGVKGHYLQAGVYKEECYLDEERGGGNDVMFVGSKFYHKEWQYRPELIEWLEKTYGDRFKRYGGDSDNGVVRGHELNRLYADSKVVVGDSLCLDFKYPYYWSDRVYETLGRGGFMIHPYIKGMEKHFTDEKHLVFYKFGHFEQLKRLIDYYLTHGKEREAIREAGHKHVLENHTYTNRWQTILQELGL